MRLVQFVNVVDKINNGKLTLKKAFALLDATGDLALSLSLDHPMVQGWLASPGSFPQELREYNVFLPASRRVQNGNDELVAYLNGGPNLKWAATDSFVQTHSRFILQ